ncbi:hypothetical protein EV426DRAFT_577150 [Tirmania nivea]|nr:hypothetical protein EV426DRAFT_577150 [Tirmania nivea]
MKNAKEMMVKIEKEKGLDSNSEGRDGVATDKKAVKVAREIGKLLVIVFGGKGDILNVWTEEVVRGRNALVKKLKEENKDLKEGKKMPRVWSGAKATGFMFDVADAVEASKIVKDRLIWDRRRRTVAMFEQSRTKQIESRMVVAPIGPRG